MSRFCFVICYLLHWRSAVYKYIPQEIKATHLVSNLLMSFAYININSAERYVSGISCAKSWLNNSYKYWLMNRRWQQQRGAATHSNIIMLDIGRRPPFVHRTSEDRCHLIVLLLFVVRPVIEAHWISRWTIYDVSRLQDLLVRIHSVQMRTLVHDTLSRQAGHR